ncbi:phage tail family protein [Paenibacillus sp. J5C_2022]|uniref:phage tail family protein n=1 Tax=Paenibacillus sp. J5C2022 TaxID=2977129 RepID=UPI0021D104C0|nr:phage tail family protein [Paenibacillus sp. J5C2022]MCU6710076.1 phage tail family protein [Paenibacillus sp. J5C2022]
MTTWLQLSGLQGYYESEAVTLSNQGDGVWSVLEWDADLPLPESLVIATSLSFNNGFDWTDWREAVNGGSIPDLEPTKLFDQVMFKFRAYLTASGPENVPVMTQLSLSVEPVVILDNKGDAECRPEIWLTKKGTGDFELRNTSNGDESFRFTEILDGEKLYVHNEREYIESDLPAVYRYNNFNDNYLRLPVGNNIFRVTGSASFQFRYSFKLI